MSSRKCIRRKLSPELVNSFLREVQQGTLPELSRFLKSHCPPASLAVDGYVGHGIEVADLLMCTNRHGDTPLLVAARHGHVSLLQTLLEDQGVPLEHTNTDGKTALHEAAQSGQTGCVQFLLGLGAHVDSLKRADWTPLMLACTKDDVETVRLLVENGASLSLRNKDGWTSFHIACREGHADVLNYLLDSDPQCWDTQSKNGRTPLHTIALRGHLEAAEILLKRLAPPGYWDRGRCDGNAADSCGVSPFMDAVRGNQVAMAEFLMNRCGARLDAEDVLGRQAVHHAAQAGALGALDCMIRLGADVNKLASVNNITPLHYAAKEGQAETIALLLQHGVDPTVVDKRGRTALDVARNARDPQRAVSAFKEAVVKASL